MHFNKKLWNYGEGNCVVKNRYLVKKLKRSIFFVCEGEGGGGGLKQKVIFKLCSELFDAHENLVRALDRGDGDESVKKNAIAKLTQGLYSVGR